MDNALVGDAAGLMTTTLSYAASASHLLGLGSLGFAATARTNDASGRVSSSTFSQDYTHRLQGHKLSTAQAIAATGVANLVVNYTLTSTEAPETPGVWTVRGEGTMRRGASQVPSPASPPPVRSSCLRRRRRRQTHSPGRGWRLRTCVQPLR